MEATPLLPNWGFWQDRVGYVKGSLVVVLSWMRIIKGRMRVIGGRMVQGRTLNEWNLVHVIRQDTTRAALPINPAACYVSHFRWRKLMMLVTTATVVTLRFGIISLVLPHLLVRWK